MRKKRIRTAPLDRLTNSAVRVEKFESLTNECKRVIENALAISRLGFVPRQVAGNRTVCSLTGLGATRAGAKYRYSVIPFLELRSRIYWLAASLEFVFENKMYRLLSVSLLIFEGDAIDDRKSALLRAEWACPDDDARALHAQPHWHIYPSRINRGLYGEQEQVEFESKAEIQSFNPETLTAEHEEQSDSEWDSAEKFHFAMASRWHIGGKDAHQEEMQFDRLLKWLDGCIRYIRSQLEFLYGKQ